MKKEYTCFFTGHRKINCSNLEQLKVLLEKNIIDLIENKGIIDFIVGGALGFDTIAAESVIELKKIYPYIRLNIYIPCIDQSKLWNIKDKFTWNLIKTKADSVVYISNSNYYNGCMRKRNYKMAEDAGYCIAFCINPQSGTGSTVSYAKKCGNFIYNIADEF